MLASRLFNTLEKGIWINEIQDRLDHQGKQYAIARAQIADLCRRYETEERLCTFRNEFESCKSLEIDRWLKPLTSINVRVYICIYIYHISIDNYPNYTTSSRIIIHWWSNNIVNFFERLTREAYTRTMARPSHGWCLPEFQARNYRNGSTAVLPLEEELRVINAATFKDTVN